ncbi:MULTISPECIES: AzlD domain-containing protein [Pseudovibrio]|uniref:AzlD domain-containing protein n=1 Tax=Stappiaceae TaxID=2821832 RepID=UPI00236596C0|nr:MULTISPECIES: AzlD domain-containing protein [Pseudovibrio]MDD7910680.1 AzlD domain-containing protein [Pseudovibrio exalbescens]MDX5594481.1 AzlD domain-containing protein [Pseudovibrio sp. SPO723]
MTGDMMQTWWWPYLMIFFAGWIATDIWRWIGVYAAGRIDEESEILVWVRAVATALIAAIIARLILFPEGPLAETPVWLRLVATAWGFATFKLCRDHLLAGVATAELVLISGWLVVV